MLHVFRRSLSRWMLAIGASLGVAWPAFGGAVDAPELGRSGPLAVGLQRWTVPVSEAQDLPQRQVDALFWYPAQGGTTAATPLQRQVQSHPWRGWKSASLTLGFPSLARPDAPPLASTPLPLLIVSHGLLNVGESFHAMAEHLASHGYGVLVLQHNDEAAADPLKAAIGLRPFDQASALQHLRKLNSDGPWAGKLNVEKVALLGYSIGGLGAMLSAGARLDATGALHGWTPLAHAHAKPLTPGQQTLRDALAAVILIAPWGGQSHVGGFNPAGLAGLRSPLLTIVGEQDDVSGYQDGVRSIWEGAKGAPRWLLTLEGARHNIATAGLPTGLPSGWGAWEALEEPVWRRERLVDVNNHFITAFLNLHLRGDSAAAQWLTLATERSNDGQWQVPFGTPNRGDFAGPARGAVTHWQGFQRRWAVGMRLERRTVALP
jgi:predicted dienelactone hydrolase